MKRFVLQFGSYELDTEAGRLYKRGLPLTLKRQAVRLLAILAVKPFEVVARERIAAELWNRPEQSEVDIEGRINSLLREVRGALSDDAKNPRFIETIPRKGYRFITGVRRIEREHVVERPRSDNLDVTAPLDQLPAGLDPPKTADTPDSARKQLGQFSNVLSLIRSRRGIAGAAVAFFLAISLVGWRSESAVRELQLTTNANLPEARLQAVAISPNSEYLACAGPGGLYLRSVTNRQDYHLSGFEEVRVAKVAWFPDSVRLLVTGQSDDGAWSMWSKSILNGDAPLHLAAGASDAVPSPDGKRIAYITPDGSEIWLMESSGERPRRVVTARDSTTLADLGWLPDQRLLFRSLQFGDGSYDVALEVADADGKIETVFFNPYLTGSCVSGTGEIFFSLMDLRDDQLDSSIWNMPKGLNNGRKRRIAEWTGVSVHTLSANRDGTQLAHVRGLYQADAYVSDLRSPHELVNARRFTSDDRNDFPTAWTRDSKGILFHSDRNGRQQIFLRRFDNETTQVLVADPDDARGARMSPNGRWIFYLKRPPSTWRLWAAAAQLVQVPLLGGPSREIFSNSGFYTIRCPAAENASCVAGDRQLDSVAFHRVDPETGGVQPLFVHHLEERLAQHHWDLSPDGQRWASVQTLDRETAIQILGPSGRVVHSIPVTGWTRLQSLDWDAAGEGWYVSSRFANGSRLLHIDSTGSARLVRPQEGSFSSWGIPSPDGKHLAFLEWTTTGQAWMIEGF